MRGNRYQISLILLGLAVTLLFGYFFYKELFPEYRIYQKDYVALEEFRSTYTGEPAPVFTEGVKQIVFEREDKGPAAIDRCVSCHVALQLPHFSPTKLALDINGNIERADDGTPLQIANENYVWGKLNQKILELTDEKVNEQLTNNGESSKVKERLKEADDLASLKTANVDHHHYDVTKVLRMHPLIGKETRPFEFHPLEDYGCVVCHSGNGRGLTTEKAHGPVFDGDYETEFMGTKPEFTEKDKLNDPLFATIFNSKPGDALLFQTTPILVGHLIQSSCVQCHKQSDVVLKGLETTATSFAASKKKANDLIQKGYNEDKEALLSLMQLKESLSLKGLPKTIKELKSIASNPATLPKEEEATKAKIKFLNAFSDPQLAVSAINAIVIKMLGSTSLEEELGNKFFATQASMENLERFVTEHVKDSSANGTLFVKYETVQLQEALLKHIQLTQNSVSNATQNALNTAAMTSDIDWLTENYQRGKQLYVSQACYACHKISGMARGGIGPELTHAGGSYPWYLKESIVWPQADLRTSTMPNFYLDSIELEDLMTFLLAQKGLNKTISDTDYKVAIQEWEGGNKTTLEKPITPSQVLDLKYSMKVFAVEGCAACHRLKGFESNVGYAIEKEDKPDFKSLEKEHQWFQKLIPEDLLGSTLVSVIDSNQTQIDHHLVDHVKKDGLLEEIDKDYPEAIEALYSNFRYASRAKNHHFQTLIDQATDPLKKEQILAELSEWKKRVHRVLMMYIQEYGLGRLIGPKINWSGVYRSDEWLMEHFHNPSGHVPKSIMPVMPFDDSKFYALIHMLNVLGIRNRDAVHALWKNNGFDPEQAYEIHCAQCHGTHQEGGGPVATWIYPIPKNLQNAEFLRNLTRENARHSIHYGVKGTPMAPWGETPKDKETYDGIPVLSTDEIEKLVDWLYSFLPGAVGKKGIKDIPKWNYTPQEILEEMRKERGELIPSEPHEEQKKIKRLENTHSLYWEKKFDPSKCYASLDPVAYVSKPLQSEMAVDDVFDVVSDRVATREEDDYYIKRKYYTKENLEMGKVFFDINCASCHGNDADGSSIKASVMLDAKPRMLTNIDWLSTRDDLWLIRSIKYGVAGTAMTPWGDFTSSLQRMQLVMYIRSLSFEKEKRERLTTILYQAFDENQMQINKAREREYRRLNELQTELLSIKTSLNSAVIESSEEGKTNADAVKLYQQQLELEYAVGQHQGVDQQLIDLIEMVKKEKDHYQNMGNNFITNGLDDVSWESFMKMIALNEGRYSFKDKKLTSSFAVDKQKTMERLLTLIIANMDTRISQLTTSPEINAEKKLKAKFLLSTEEISLLRKQEDELLKTFNASQKENTSKNNLK